MMENKELKFIKKLRKKIAFLIFRFSQKYLSEEFNALISQVALQAANVISVNMIRESFKSEGLQVCERSECTQRFGLVRTGGKLLCVTHARRNSGGKNK